VSSPALALALESTLAAWTLLFAGILGLAFTVNAFAPIRRSRWLVVPSSLISMLAAELAAQHLLWQVIGVGALVLLGALDRWMGWVGLTLSSASWIGLLALVMKGRGAASPIAAALQELGAPSAPFDMHYARLLNPLPLRFDRKRVHRNVEYARAAGRRLRLDIHFPPESFTGPRPAVVQVHGGGWVVGDKREQGRPLLAHLATRGFVGFNVNYRLSPGATFPDHLVDIKRAIAWIREHAAELRVDAGFIAVTGGSAGGHLAAMAALTAHEPRFQPGFETADTTVQAAIPLYGIYDLANHSARHAPGFHDMLLEPLVIKAFFAEEPEKFVDASPIAHVGPHAPPFFVIHGDRDTMAPLADARDFVAALREVSHQPVLFAEIGGAQHAFDVFVSPRSLPVIQGVARFLEHLYAHQHPTRAVPVDPQSLRASVSDGADVAVQA
jgi:acetyl esterase/lipase